MYKRQTVITKEYPIEASSEKEPYYPINDSKNTSIFKAYQDLAKKENTIFGGRLAEYKYYDMHQVIGAALSKTKKMFAWFFHFFEKNPIILRNALLLFPSNQHETDSIWDFNKKSVGKLHNRLL